MGFLRHATGWSLPSASPLPPIPTDSAVSENNALFSAREQRNNGHSVSHSEIFIPQSCRTDQGYRSVCHNLIRFHEGGGQSNFFCHYGRSPIIKYLSP
jgi:hypothetical protein